jgi:hypothetical protein
MNKINRLIATSIAIGAITFGCQSENVKPKANDTKPTIGMLGEGPHPSMSPTCSDTTVLRLKSADGSYKVNYCGLAPCPPNQPEWGKLEIVNGVDSIAVYMTLAVGWFVDACDYRIAPTSSFSLDQAGLPATVGTDYSSKDVANLNRWTLFVHKNNISMDPNRIFSMASKLTVVKMGFLSGVDQRSRRSLWAANADWNVAGSNKQSMSEFLTPWQWAFCWPAADSACAVAYAGLPGNNGCATLAPSVAGATAPITYAWSSGETSASISACPSAATTYSVSVSDANGPFSVTDYQVNVVDASCRSGNSPQHKVWVCHIPPGNPNNPQDICIDWNGVPAHVARFRAPGANPNQGHDSGCEIGKCGTNPCL